MAASEHSRVGEPSARKERRGLKTLKLLYRRPASAIGTTIVLLFLLLALFGPLIAPYGENEQIAADARQPPSAAHLFGTDRLGRDVFSRVVLGTRDILALAGLGTILAVICGTIFGLVSGYLGGLFDEPGAIELARNPAPPYVVRRRGGSGFLRGAVGE